jgi:hypothetical protein
MDMLTGVFFRGMVDQETESLRAQDALPRVHAVQTVPADAG